MVRILTDSSSDISTEQAKQLGIDIVELGVTFADGQYDAKADPSFGAFYKRLASAKTLPTTSQPSPEDFLPFFESAKQNGDAVVAILISEQLSGTVQSAEIAKNMVKYDDIYIVNSRQTVIGLRLLVEHAVRLRNAGETGTSIATCLNEIKHKVKLVAIVDTLDYLFKGGRLSRASKIAGSMLNFKPIITLDGCLAVLAKERGAAKAIQFVVSLIDADNMRRDVPVYYGYTGNDEMCNRLKQAVAEKHVFDTTFTCPVGAVVGTHVGPNACVITYLEK